MRCFKTFATIGASALMFAAAAAQAADLPRPAPPPSLTLPPPAVQRAPSVIEESSSGWYLRGDVGYRMNRLGSVANLAPVPTTDDRIDKAGVGGFGVGYKMQWFRVDATLDYSGKTKYWGNTAALSPDFTARMQSVTALMNVYGDLGTWYGLTPYIGLGVGGAYLRTADFSRASLPIVAPLPAATSNWNLGWAWMAGVSYKISQNYNVDLGYRHVSFGDAMTGIDAFGNQLTFKKLTADEIRLGLRWSL
jgi:opacity protein-like surface antigen